LIDLLLILLLAGIALAIVFYIRREKKRGKKCIGCPYADQCAGHHDDGQSCQCQLSDETAKDK